MSEIVDAPTAPMIEAGVDALIGKFDLRSPAEQRAAVIAVWLAMRAAKTIWSPIPAPLQRSTSPRS